MECYLCLEYYPVGPSGDLSSGRVTGCCYHWTCGNCVTYLTDLDSAEDQSNPVCPHCHQNLMWSQGCGTTAKEISLAQQHLTAGYQAMQEFYQTTATLPWCLDDDQTWAEHYGAEIKAFELATSRLEALTKLAHDNLLRQVDLPPYSFQRPGVVVTDYRGYRAVVTDYYGLGSGPAAARDFRTVLATILTKATEHSAMPTKSAEAVMTLLSRHCRTTWAIVEANLDLKWNWHWLSSNANISSAIVAAHPELPWTRSGLLANRNTSLELVKTLLAQSVSDANLTKLSHNPNISYDFIISGIAPPGSIAWDYRQLGRNPALTWSDITRLQTIVSAEQYYELLTGFSSNPNLTEDLVVSWPNLEWSYGILTRHPAISWSFINQHPEIPWDYYWLSGSDKVDLDTVLSRPDLFTIYNRLAANPNVTVAMMQAQPGISSWDSYVLCRNPNITFDLVKQYPDGPTFLPNQAVTNPTNQWAWLELTQNPNCNLAVIRDQPDWPWAWSNIFINVMSVKLAKLGWKY